MNTPDGSHKQRHAVVIGAGAVGLEFAYVYAMYGAKVTVVEMAAQALPDHAAFHRFFARADDKANIAAYREIDAA